MIQLFSFLLFSLGIIYISHAYMQETKMFIPFIL
jgi:hypothetical protein